MKRNSKWVMTGAFVFMAIMLLSSNVSAKTMLRLNSQWSEHMTGSKVTQWFADEIGKATNGEVKIKVYFSQALGKAGENLHLLRQGAIDMADMSPAYFPAELPLITAANTIPFGFKNICQGSAIAEAFMDEIPAYREEAKRNNIRLLFTHLLSDYLIVTREPVKNLSDLQGKKIRTWGKELPALFSAAGAIGVTAFIPEVYENLQRGVVDGTVLNTDGCVAYKLYEVAKNVTEVVIWQGPAWGTFINEDVWQKLSDDHKKIFLQTAQKAREKEIAMTHSAAIAARKVLKENGVQFQQFPEEDLVKWRNTAPDFRANFVKEMEKQGKGQAAREMIKIWDNINKWVTCP